MVAPVVFDGVWKKFRRGERHDNLRDLVPAMVRRLTGRAGLPVDLANQEFWALQDVSFEVHPGEALGIIGPNGAGKSTALKLLTKILKPTRGQCHVHGRVGALIEVAAGFHPDLTGRENVYLQGAIMGMKRVEIAGKLDQIVEFAGIAEFIDTPTKRYSSGMNARLGFAIAAHLNPDVLLIDEVLSVGDMEFQRRCIARMQEIKRSGAALVFVSHDLSAVRLMCTRALLIDRGRVVCEGDAPSVIQQYAAGARADRTVDGDDVRPVQPAQASAEVVNVRIPPGRQMLALRPADEIRFSLTVTLPAPLEELVFVTYVVQQETQAVAHNSNRTLRFGSGGSAAFHLDVRLRLNLTRGVYALNFSVYDPRIQQHLVWLRPAAIVGIEDLDSYAGVAHLDVRLEPSEIERAEVVA